MGDQVAHDEQAEPHKMLDAHASLVPHPVIGDQMAHDEQPEPPKLN
jgi:hypothetical protein